MSTKAVNLQLIRDLSLQLVSDETIERFYDDAIRELGRFEILTKASLIAATSGTATYSLPEEAVQALAYFWDTRALDVARHPEVECRNIDWRGESGAPLAVVLEDETEDSFRLYPNPNVTSDDFIFLLGAPFGVDFPANSIGVIHTEYRETIPDYLDLPIVFSVLAREFGRDSNHRDELASSAYREMAAFLLSLLKIDFVPIDADSNDAPREPR